MKNGTKEIQKRHKIATKKMQKKYKRDEYQKGKTD